MLHLIGFITAPLVPAVTVAAAGFSARTAVKSIDKAYDFALSYAMKKAADKLFEKQPKLRDMVSRNELIIILSSQENTDARTLEYDEEEQKYYRLSQDCYVVSFTKAEWGVFVDLDTDLQDLKGKEFDTVLAQIHKLIKMGEIRNLIHAELAFMAGKKKKNQSSS